MPAYPPAVAFADFTGAPEPLVEGMQAGSNASPATGQQPCPHSWGVTEVTVSAIGKSSRSFSAREHVALAAGRATDGRFYFAPSKDTVTVAWKLRNPTNATGLKVEVYRRGSGVPIWIRMLDAEATKALSFDWNGEFGEDECAEPAAFPDDMLTAERGPYMLKITAQGRAETTYVERWTYLDVLVHSLTLEWAEVPEKVIPAARAARAKHVEVNRRLKDGTDADNLRAALPAVGETKKVYLKTNVFYQGDSDLKGERNQYFGKVQALWGEGAMIPVYVRAKIRDVAGDAADIPAALGKARFLWDYEDKGTHDVAGATDPIKAFLRKLGRHLPDATAYAPAGINCHVSRGGKRGQGGSPVFPPQAGVDAIDVLPDAGDPAPSFPFKVTACGTRRWAAISEVWREGVLAGRSGVLFQPSRIGGDAYALHVYYVAGAEDAAVAGADDRDNVAAEIKASTGTFAVWHSVDIAKYVQIGNGAADVDIGAVITMTAKHYMKLEYDPVNKVNGTAQFRAGMRKVYPLDGTLRARLASYIQDALPTTTPTGQGTLIEYLPFARWRRNWIGRNGSLGQAYATARGIVNPTNALGEQKFDWIGRGTWDTSHPFRAPFPIDSTNVVDTPGVHGKVVCEFTDPKNGAVLSHTVQFEPDKRITRDKNLDVPLADKIELAKLYMRCVQDANGQHPGYRPGVSVPIAVTLKGKTGGDNQQRITNLQAAFDEIVEASASGDNDTSNFPADVAGALGGKTPNAGTYQNTAAYEWVWNIIQLVLADQFPAAAGGLYILQMGNGIDICNFHGPKAKAMYAPVGGATLVIVLGPAAQAPTLAHEVGHANYVNHTYVTDAGNDPLSLHQADAAGTCTMMKSGTSARDTFCGICMLRMRGWSIFEVTDPVAPTFNATQVLRHDA